MQLGDIPRLPYTPSKNGAELFTFRPSNSIPGDIFVAFLSLNRKMAG
jgi:hypothetical protein